MRLDRTVSPLSFLRSLLVMWSHCMHSVYSSMSCSLGAAYPHNGAGPLCDYFPKLPRLRPLVISDRYPWLATCRSVCKAFAPEAEAGTEAYGNCAVVCPGQTSSRYDLVCQTGFAFESRVARSPGAIQDRFSQGLRRSGSSVRSSSSLSPEP